MIAIIVVIINTPMGVYLSVASARISFLLDDVLDAVRRKFVADALLGACFSVDRLAVSFFIKRFNEEMRELLGIG